MVSLPIADVTGKAALVHTKAWREQEREKVDGLRTALRKAFAAGAASATILQ